jgi:hypothetical protein
MNKFLSSIVVAVVLSLSAVSSASAQDNGAKANETKSVGYVVFYEVEGLDELFVSSAQAIGAAQNAGIQTIWITTVRVPTKTAK